MHKQWRLVGRRQFQLLEGSIFGGKGAVLYATYCTVQSSSVFFPCEIRQHLRRIGQCAQPYEYRSLNTEYCLLPRHCREPATTAADHRSSIFERARRQTELTIGLSSRPPFNSDSSRGRQCSRYPLHTVHLTADTCTYMHTVCPVCGTLNTAPIDR